MAVSLILYYSSFAYAFQICKDMFLKTVDISQSMIKKALDTHDEDRHRAPEGPEACGAHNKTLDAVVTAVEDHINSFPSDIILFNQLRHRFNNHQYSVYSVKPK